MRPALRQARTLLNHEAYHNSIPTFLCPALLRAPVTSRSHSSLTAKPKTFSTCSRARQQSNVATAPGDSPETLPLDVPPAARPTQPSLPRACPGCGAASQVFDKQEAGYYNVDRNAVYAYLKWSPKDAQEVIEEDEIYKSTLKNADAALLGELGLDSGEVEAPPKDEGPETPVCDRCHNLINHSVGSPIHHPSVEAIQQTIAESPHRRNHIYHVVDAADFPLSIVPQLQASLRIPKLRTQNRRAKHKGWVANDRIAEISFIVTRADLLAPKKEQVDALMPYVQDVLRDALGRENRGARLGNVRLVSAKRGWWTKQVKEDIWERGGAGWMVGKVNVGKSNLFEAVFPKGRGADYQQLRITRTAAEREAMINAAKTLEDLNRVHRQLADEDAESERLLTQPQEHQHKPPNEEPYDPEDEFDDPNALLPPPQPYTLFPVLPIASSLPGTTASPIRIPFGRNRGELIDMPGLARTNPGLETFVQPASHSELVMTSRINSERYVLRPGQSLILGGGLIRITPVTQDLVFILHPFVPIHPHVTRTDKAIDYQSQLSRRSLQVRPILAPSAGPQMSSAGIFPLKWDATKLLAGPLTRKEAGRMKIENLPFRIWSTDILIEGVGWIEVSAQTRRAVGWKAPGMIKKDPNHARVARLASLAAHRDRQERKFAAEASNLDADELLNSESPRQDTRQEQEVWDEDPVPEVQVFSPLGKFIGQRKPMCASTVSGPKYVASRDRKERPRRSMVSVKRQRGKGGEVKERGR